MTGVSTHILDISLGQPAAGVKVMLEQSNQADWREISAQTTDADGRVKQLLPVNEALTSGQYRLTFATQAYFDAQGVQGLYPIVQITFTVTNISYHYHIPLLLTANGYSTYRGS